MVCAEIIGLVRTPPRDISNEEIEAIFDWHATRCAVCLGRYRNPAALGGISTTETIFRWFAIRSGLIATAREKMWAEHTTNGSKA